MFGEKKDYVRRQIIFGLLQVRHASSRGYSSRDQHVDGAQEDDPASLHIIASFLLLDGKQNEATFETLNEEGGFSRILELIHSSQDDAALHRILLQLLYEMSRIQRIRDQDLSKLQDLGSLPRR